VLCILRIYDRTSNYCKNQQDKNCREVAQGGLSNMARDGHRKAHRATHGDGDGSARRGRVA
jgi:hypothetical protein